MMRKRERLRDEQKLRRYLLGRCSPQESDEIDEAIVIQSDVSDLLEVLENDIAEAYVERLRDGDPPTEQHFGKYFEQLLRIKLRARILPSDKMEDLLRETLTRAIAAVRRDAGVREPERFPAFVNAICNNVLMEHYRSAAKNQPMDDTHLEIPDKVLDLEGMLVREEAS